MFGVDLCRTQTGAESCSTPVVCSYYAVKIRGRTKTEIRRLREQLYGCSSLHSPLSGHVTLTTDRF